MTTPAHGAIDAFIFYFYFLVSEHLLSVPLFTMCSSSDTLQPPRMINLSLLHHNNILFSLDLDLCKNLSFIYLK